MNVNTEVSGAPAPVNIFEKIIGRLVDFCAFVGGIALTIMMFITAFDVILRLFSKSILGAFEVEELLMGVCIPFALCYCEKMRQHICVDLVIQKLPIKARRWLNFCTSILVMVLFFTIGIMCWINVFNVREDQLTTAVLLISLWPFAIPSAIAFSVLFLQYINHIVKIFKTIVTGEGEVI